jgi:hypothetical protein
VPAALARDRLRGRRGIAGDGEVEIVDLAAKRRVADRPARDPDPLRSAERAPGEDDERGRCELPRDAHARARGTLAEIPQVTS